MMMSCTILDAIAVLWDQECKSAKLNRAAKRRGGLADGGATQPAPPEPGATASAPPSDAMEGVADSPALAVGVDGSCATQLAQACSDPCSTAGDEISSQAADVDLGNAPSSAAEPVQPIDSAQSSDSAIEDESAASRQLQSAPCCGSDLVGVSGGGPCLDPLQESPGSRHGHAGSAHEGTSASEESGDSLLGDDEEGRGALAEVDVLEACAESGSDATDRMQVRSAGPEAA